MDKVVIKDYYHMTTMDKNIIRIKLAHSMSFCSLNLKSPLLYIYLYFKIKYILFYMHTLEKNNTFPLRILCTLVPQLIPLLTLTLVCTWCEISSPGVTTQCKLLLPIALQIIDLPLKSASSQLFQSLE